jgi:hypothetical protein
MVLVAKQTICAAAEVASGKHSADGLSCIQLPRASVREFYEVAHALSNFPGHHANLAEALILLSDLVVG